jgi:hypothetical protein
MINSSSDAAGTDLAKPPEMTPEERAVLSAHIARRKQKRPSPRVKLVEKAGSSVELSADHPIPHLGNALIMESLGTADFDFYNGLLTQLANVGTQGKPDERGTNFLLAMVRGIGPKDEIEAMMAAQMAAVHMTTMTFARRLADVDNLLQQDSAERAFNKLARTFAVQVEALKRYRTGGEQKVTVQHVTVNEGGQAIVGSVSPQVGGMGDAAKS